MSRRIEKIDVFMKKILERLAGITKKHYLCIAFREMLLTKDLCGNSSVGRARPCQGRGREFESRLPLFSCPFYF